VNCDERRARFPRLLIPHLLAVVVMLWQAWFVYQPIYGDIAFWSPAAATFLAAAIWLVAGGCFALVRWGMYRPLLLADLAALPAVFFGSLGFVIFFGGVAIAILLLLGMVMVWRARDRFGQRPRSSPRAVQRASVAVLAMAVVVFWWYGLSVAYDFIGLVTDYGLAEVMTGGMVGAAILLWLDRPELLLGASLFLIYFGAFGLANGVDTRTLETIVESAILLASGLFAVVLAGHDLFPSRGVDLLIPIAVAVGCAGAVLLEPLLVPFVVAAAIVLERPIDLQSPPVTAVPTVP
jgi:hypothetical protein